MLLPSEAYVRFLAVISILPALGSVFFFFAAGYLEALFVFTTLWGLSYLALSYVAHLLIPPRLVLRHYGSLVTLDLNERDELEPTPDGKHPSN
ncbi:MAG TPA: hypothetical protein VEG30_08875 [Terriglobales bacterium]|nr:hypothetical protein [Terriglobales bacterium]